MPYDHFMTDPKVIGLSKYVMGSVTAFGGFRSEKV